MKNFIPTILAVFAFSMTALPQQNSLVDVPPASVIVNVGLAIYDISLDENLKGATTRNDALGKVTVEVELDGDGGLLLKIPERRVSYGGRYDVMVTINLKHRKSAKRSAQQSSATALVTQWDSWSQDNALSILKSEIEWRAVTEEFTLLVNENNRRVYVTPNASAAMKKVGAVISAEEFSMPRAAYNMNLRSYKGAVIFDTSGSVLTMRLIDEKGRDSTFSIKKNGEVLLLSPKKEPAPSRPRFVDPAERPRIVTT